MKAREACATDERVAVMHLTDTLEIGGAERVAINLVNRLPRSAFVPHLCATRRSGPLAELVAPDVQQLTLDRCSTFDMRGVWKLVQYIRRHNIQILHAHGTTVFVAAAASLVNPYPAVIWHIHYGRYASERSAGLPYRAIRGRIRWTIAVSQVLADWARDRVRFDADRVTYAPNFSVSPGTSIASPSLPGSPGERIVCVANLLPEKDHLTLLRAMELVLQKRPAAHLLLVGGGSESEWGKQIAAYIDRRGLAKNVTALGQWREVGPILRAVDIGVLSSRTEGLPLALVEYGETALPVVVTDVGQCADVVDRGSAGRLVAVGDAQGLADAILDLLASSEQRAQLGRALQARVRTQFSDAVALQRISVAYAGALRDETAVGESHVR